jgi:hypothetical protein
MKEETRNEAKERRTEYEREPTIPQSVISLEPEMRKINIKRVTSYSYYVISCQVTPSYMSFLN